MVSIKKTSKPLFSVWRSTVFSHAGKSQFGAIIVPHIRIFVNPPRTGGLWRRGFARSASQDSEVRRNEVLIGIHNSRVFFEHQTLEKL
jgi:hypothetical protein